jgi:haloalkane dehalogenase
MIKSGGEVEPGKARFSNDGAPGGTTPKLLLTFEGAPSLLIGNEMVVWCATHSASLETASCGQAGHHAPEDRPKEIAAAISDWADRHGLR